MFLYKSLENKEKFDKKNKEKEAPGQKEGVENLNNEPQKQNKKLQKSFTRKINKKEPGRRGGESDRKAKDEYVNQGGKIYITESEDPKKDKYKPKNRGQYIERERGRSD